MSDYYDKLQEKETFLYDLREEEEILEKELQLKKLKQENTEEEERALELIREKIENTKQEIKDIKQEEEDRKNIVKLTKELEDLKKKREEKLAERARSNQIRTCEHDYQFDKTGNFTDEDFGDIFTEEYTYTADVYNCTKCGQSIKKRYKE